MRRREVSRLGLSAAGVVAALLGLGCRRQGSIQSPLIHDVQGRGHLSPLRGQTVLGLRGRVSQVADDGFYLLAPTPDDDDATSEGLFVFTRRPPDVEAAWLVEVDGTVAEFYPGGRDAGGLSVTQVVHPAVRRLGLGVEASEPLLLGESGRRLPAAVVCDDAHEGDVESEPAVFDPEADGLDFFESLEGMLVEVRDAVLVAPANEFNEVWVLAGAGAGAGPRTARGGILLRPGDPNPERVQLQWPRGPGATAPRWNVSDRLARVRGVVSYDHGSFEVLCHEAPEVIPGGLRPETTDLSRREGRLLVASYNVANLHRGERRRLEAIARQIAQDLGAPELVALQEVEDDSGPENDGTTTASATLEALVAAIRGAGGPRYQVAQVDPLDGEDGGQPGANIRAVFLYDPARLKLSERPAGDALSAVAVAGGRLSLSVGRIAPAEPVFRAARKLLAAEFEHGGLRLFAVNVHLTSKRGSSPSFGRLQPPRNAGLSERRTQVEAIRRFVEQLLGADAGARVIVLGDFNEHEFLEPLRLLTARDGTSAAVLVNLTESLSEAERYTYNFQGNSQALDHVLVSPSLARGVEYDAVHLNSEFAGAVSDHDPLVASLSWGGE
jgi:hypothetical protein